MQVQSRVRVDRAFTVGLEGLGNQSHARGSVLGKPPTTQRLDARKSAAIHSCIRCTRRGEEKALATSAETYCGVSAYSSPVVTECLPSVVRLG
jgi:hypothetical protein